MATKQVPPGWYEDDATPGALRYWDGVDWTEHIAPLPAKSDTGWLAFRLLCGVAGVALLVLAFLNR